MTDREERISDAPDQIQQFLSEWIEVVFLACQEVSFVRLCSVSSLQFAVCTLQSAVCCCCLAYYSDWARQPASQQEREGGKEKTAANKENKSQHIRAMEKSSSPFSKPGGQIKKIFLTSMSMFQTPLLTLFFLNKPLQSEGYSNDIERIQIKSRLPLGTGYQRIFFIISLKNRIFMSVLSDY